jgi:asparagine synthase (glutamine-hydrolysing)
MRKLLPDGILYRKKVGFRVPFGRWLRGPYRDFAQDMLESDASYITRICNRAKLSQLLSEHLEGRQNHERVLWSLINLEIFLREFKPSQLEEATMDLALTRAA